MRAGPLALGIAAALTLPLAAQAAIPAPDQDPFYDAPSGLAAKARGTVLRSRQVAVTLSGLPLVPAKAYQLLYRSNDTKGRPTAVVTTVLVPHRPHPGKRPLVSYQAAIDSLGSACNPSYTLRTGTQRELIALIPLLLNGWAVTVPDYEGPRNAYTAGMIAARSVLDGIRATERFAPAGLSGKSTPVGLWGYSGGGQATAWAGEQHPEYAPELNIRAIAAGGVPPDVEEVANQIDGGPFFGIYFAATIGLSREFPEVDVNRLLNAKGKALKAEVEDACVADLVFGHAGHRMSEYTTVPNLLTDPQVRPIIEAVKLGKVTPTAPVFIYHSVFDQLIPVTGPDALVQRYCLDGADVYYRRDLLGEHIAYAFAGAPAAIDYISRRFAGKPAPNNCKIRGKRKPRAGACTSGRALRLEPRRRRGERIRSIVARVKGRRVARRSGRDLKAIRIRGLEPGTHRIRLRITSNRRTRIAIVRRTVRCRA